MSRPFVPLTDGAQVIIPYVFSDGTPVSVRLWFIRRSGSVTTTTLQDLANGVQSWHNAEVLPFLSQDITQQIVFAIDWTSSGNTGVFATSSGSFGGVAFPSESAIVAALIRFQSVQPPRNFYNWNYLPGVPSSELDLNTLRGTWRNHIRNAYIDLIDLAPVFGPFPAWRWVCTSQEENGSPRSDQLALATSRIFVRPIVAPRRRRLP